MDLPGLVVTETDGIVTCRIDRPQARNALTGETIAALTEFARAYRTRPSVRAAIVTGAPGYFSAGADLGAARPDGERVEMTLLELREAVLAGPDMCRAFEEMECITIAAIEGYCVGGATALAVACDFRILGAGAQLRLPEVPLGMNMSWRTLPRLETLIGPSRAKRFAVFGEFADAARCLEWGLADEVVPAGEALAEAGRWAAKVADLPPIAVRMTKEAINATANALHHATSVMDRDQYLLTFRSNDLREGITAFFEKRKPVFRGD